MKGYRVMILFLLLVAMLSGACGLFTFGIPAAATPETGLTATALVQTIQALSTQNELLLPTNTPDGHKYPTANRNKHADGNTHFDSNAHQYADRYARRL